MHLTGETKFFIGVAAASLAILIGGVVLLSRPAPTFSRDELITPDTITRGNASASAYLVEFSDFQCPACRSFKPTIDAILAKDSDKLTFAYRHFPLPQHQFGSKAAEVAEAARSQGKFWEMYDYLFNHQEQFSDEFLDDSLKIVASDSGKLKDEVSNGKYKDKVQTDTSAGNKFGVNATPTFFLNGKKLNVANPAALQAAVDAALAGK